ncbi:hypothetical protein [Rhizobium sp. FKY42]|uniref:hypothetical protein n=1 Tax=Rhizobium sp. FKY42 TaxID=2562310 RepID=UPI0010BF69D3|nr:hypothetical protein [Rhizobium sp. FKY42]
MAKAPRSASEAPSATKPEEGQAPQSKTSSAAVSPIIDDRSAYVVSDKAPPRVAGRRVQAGDVLRLTEEEARGELLALHIRPEGLPEASEEETTEAASKDV